MLAKDVRTPEHPAIRPLDRYYFRNLLEELDAPGEWYLDQRTWTLYFWPPTSVSQGVAYAPTLQTLVEVKGRAAYVTLRGFTLECCRRHGGGPAKMP